MGLAPLPEISDYWAKGGIIHARNRFQQILRFIHVADNTTQPERKHPNYKLHKVQPIIDHLGTVFPKLYIPDQNLSIDEQMIGTKCRVSFIKYDKKIWHKRLYVRLCSGYVLGFQIYTGKTNGQGETRLSFRVVCELTERYLNKGHRLYFDNFYTSVDLLQYLATKQTYACGTVKANRKLLAPEILDEKMQKGEAQFWKWNTLTAVRWKDKRDVLLLSTIHGGNTKAS
jgi:hypothetical protein